MPLSKQLGCHCSGEEHVPRSPLRRAAPPTRPLQAMGDCRPAPLPQRAMHRHNSVTEGQGLLLALPAPTHRQSSLDRCAAGSRRERRWGGTACAESKASVGTNLCHMPPLPVRDLPATGLQLFFAAVSFSFMLHPGQCWLCPFPSSGGRICPSVLLNLPYAHPPARTAHRWSARSQQDRDRDG